jgi:hypothetical protein
MRWIDRPWVTWFIGGSVAFWLMLVLLTQNALPLSGFGIAGSCDGKSLKISYGDPLISSR